MTTPAFEMQTKTDVSSSAHFDAGQVAIFPLIGLAVIKNKTGFFGGAYRAWQLAKAFDNEGAGAINLDDFKEWAKVNPRTLRQWIKDAIDLQLFVKVTFGTRLMTASTAKAAAILGCGRVDSLKVKVNISDLAGRDWKAVILAAIESRFNPRPGQRQPVSRKQLYRMTGISPRTMQRYEKKTGVKRHRNYAQSIYEPSTLSAVKEYSNHAGAFIWYDTKSNEQEIRYRLPDDRDTSKAAVQMGRGRSRKVNKTLKALGCSNRTRPAEYAGRVNLFNNTLDELDKSTKKLDGLRPDLRPAEMYLRTASHSRKYGLWSQIPTWQNLSDNSFRTTRAGLGVKGRIA